MSNKRKNQFPPSTPSSNPKRNRQDNLHTSHSSAQPPVDSTYGQRGALPVNDVADYDELFYGPASDGVEYLRMVR